jgi:hypothetical protein
MIRRGLLLGIALLSATGCALTPGLGATHDGWTYISENDMSRFYISESDMSRFYISDRPSDRVNADVVRVWLRNFPTRESPYYQKGIRETINYAECDCAARTTQLLQVTQRYADGHAATLSGPPGTPGFIIPGSSGDTILKFVCGKA